MLENQEIEEKKIVKPRIFIGSSLEGLEVARLVKDALADIADCQLWNENFFANNKSWFESLNEGSILFDFGIMVATSDDLQLKRDRLELISRDNVIFEFGLYVGRLGRDRAFLLKQKGLDIPSDLSGIKLHEFVMPSGTDQGTLFETCDEVKAAIMKSWNVFQLSFVPSTALAQGYFNNFVSIVSRRLLKVKQIRVAGKKYSDFKLSIVIPDELPDNFQDKVTTYLNRNNLQKESVDIPDTRPYPLYVSRSGGDGQCIELYDMPTTLGTLKSAIEIIIPKGHVGETEREKMLERKEMNNFYRTLKALVDKDKDIKEHVKIHYLDIK